MYTTLLQSDNKPKQVLTVCFYINTSVYKNNDFSKLFVCWSKFLEMKINSSLSVIVMEVFKTM